jgi:cytochrome c oxidase subunit 2
MNDHWWISALDPGGPQAAHVARLFWFFVATTGAVYVAVIAALAWSVLKRRAAANGAGAIAAATRGDGKAGRVVMACVVGSVAILVVLFLSSVWTQHLMAALRTEQAPTITLIGHQWWWEVAYEGGMPGSRVLTANQIHIPVGHPIAVNVTSRDVIHSFWVPALQGKRDLLPDYTSTVWLQADRSGIYRGQCAEFCGRQHALMAIEVVAESSQEFSTWLEHERQPAPSPATEEARRGHDLVVTGPCANCHTIAGTPAQGLIGPNLTHIANRRRVGAGTLPNDGDDLQQWVRNSQAAKPGNQMPPHRLAPDDLQAIVAYLGSLR